MVIITPMRLVIAPQNVPPIRTKEAAAIHCENFSSGKKNIIFFYPQCREQLCCKLLGGVDQKIFLGDINYNTLTLYAKDSF